MGGGLTGFRNECYYGASQILPTIQEGGQDVKRKMEKALFLNWKMEKA